jgi:hypothetical protein
MGLSEIFLTMLVTSSFAFLGAGLAVCYKSKCKKIACCGIVIERDIEAEEQLDEIQLQQRPTPPSYGAGPITEALDRQDIVR